MQRKAVIMAGGKGTRLAPYTAIIPKPLVPLGDISILEMILLQLKHHRITDVVLAVNHLSHLFQAYFGNGERQGLRIDYSLESHPLGTAGPLGAVLDSMSPDFFLLNGDLLTNMDFAGMYAAHCRNKADATIAVHERELKSDFGVIDMDEDGLLVGYREKPSYRHFVSMGCYVLSREAVKPFVAADTYLDMPDLMRLMMDAQKKVYCNKADCVWLDIGRPEDYAQAQELFAKQPELFLPERLTP
ncbi:MAG: NTP transferase domain-containing protein [Desulfovibrio sp.]|jgi:NDP-sugar pyrophosphorylase family protein|nr:NTP transferase domain-containing protein [Desulfovibrio sp.]